MRIAFFHPDLGIGGAERLIVDIAVELQRRGYDITIYTSHHDRKHCFEETKGESHGCGGSPRHLLTDINRTVECHRGW